MPELRQTEIFRTWRSRLKDSQARVIIASRLDRLAFGHTGDVAPVGGGVSELRIHYGPGYRIYFTQHADDRIILLCGGSKRTQARDIEAAKALARDWR